MPGSRYREEVEGDDPVLRQVLLSYKTPTLRLPESTCFEPLRPIATNVPLHDDSLFATHTTYQVPVSTQSLHVRPAQKLTDQPLVDTVHRFALQRWLSGPLNQRLTEWALHKERLGKECEERLVPVAPGPGSDAGVSKTNVGGYQSFHDLFEPPLEDDEDTQSKRDCLLLDRIVSAALDEATGDAGDWDDPYPAEAAGLRPSGGERHASYAWLNVNRTADSNFMHTHQVDLWSAVYYVSEGEPNAPGFPCPTSGHMIFRCGPRPAEEGGACLGPDGEPRCSYFAVPPTPGTLWLFPGSVPHTVMHTILPEGLPEPQIPRISIGVNFEAAIPPLARKWEQPQSWHEMLEVAKARRMRRGQNDSVHAALAIVRAPCSHTKSSDALGTTAAGGAEEGQSPKMCVATSTASEAVVEATGKSPPIEEFSAEGLQGSEEAALLAFRAKAMQEALESPFHMLTPEEARERGFEDDEVVMPMPVDSSSDSDS